MRLPRWLRRWYYTRAQDERRIEAERQARVSAARRVRELQGELHRAEREREEQRRRAGEAKAQSDRTAAALERVRMVADDLDRWLVQETGVSSMWAAAIRKAIDGREAGVRHG